MKALLITACCCLLWSCGGADAANVQNGVDGTGDLASNEHKANASASEKLLAAQEKWRSKALPRYRMNVVQALVVAGDNRKQAGATPTPEGTSTKATNLMVIVEAGRVSELYTESQEAYLEYDEAHDLDATDYSVAALFDFVADKIEHNLVVGEIEYHPELGFPESFQYLGGEEQTQFIHFYIAEFYDPQAMVARLTRAKDAWLAQAIDDYFMTLKLICDGFCEGTGEVYSDVVSNECIAKGYREPPTVNVALDYYPNSIANLFDRAIAQAHVLDSRFEITMHASGYLESYYLGSPFGFSGGDTGIRVASFDYTL
ncbi:MAG TPA: DUF6174 domain-containing protein [Marinagarivorans sp.]